MNIRLKRASRFANIVALGGLLCFAVSCSVSPSFHILGGKQIHFSDYRGKWVFVNYWATWCQSCSQEIPALNLYAQQHEQTVAIFGVNYDLLPVDNLKKAVKQLNITFPILLEDPKNALQLATVEVMPTTFLLDPQGRLVKTLLGPQSASTLTAAIHEAEASHAVR